MDDDGLTFDRDTIEAAPIREDAVYDSVGVKLVAFLGTAPPAKVAQWNAFIRRSRLSVDAPSLADAIERSAEFVGPALREP